MLRHRLAALFEPNTLLVLSDRPLPIVQSVPRSLQDTLTIVDASEGASIRLPETLNGVASGSRIDQALVCVAPRRMHEALAALKSCRPRILTILPHSIPPANPIEDMFFCRTWGELNDCLILGPRSFGVQRPHLGINLTHESHVGLGGRVALVAQSRSITASVLDWAEDVRLGFSAVVSLGDEGTVDVADVLDYLAMDPRTDSIALYLEEASSSRRFTSALRAAASVKPVIVLKVGQNADAASAEDAVFNALLRRAGAVRIRYFVQLFSAIKVLVYTRRPRGRKIALFSNGDGAAKLALDVMGDTAEVFRADLALPTVKLLEELMEHGAANNNPVVTYGPLTPQKVRQIVTVLVDDPGVDGVLVLLAPDPLSDLQSVARQLADISPDSRKPIITCFMGDATMRPLRHILDSVGTPAFRTPESAANAFGILAAYHYNQTLSQQTLPPEALSKPPRLDEARALVRAAQSQRRTCLTLEECRQLLDCFHVPMHFADIEEGLAPGEHDDGIPMFIKVSRDAKFGPYITFGRGGQDATFSDPYNALQLPPLNSYLARQLVVRSAVWQRGLSRQVTPAAFAILQESLERISGLVSEMPSVDSLLIDPVFADDMRLVAHSVRIELTTQSMLVLPETTRYEHMAIHPYPRRLVQTKKFKDGNPWMLRPIRPEDAEPLQEFVRGLSDEARYMRFISMMRELTPRMLARYTRIDYDRELALIATVQVPNPEHRGHPREQIIGFAHYLRNPDGRGAEYALVIGDAWQRRGLGSQLMRGLIEAAQLQGLTYIDGVVLAANRPMLSLMAHLGFRNDPDNEDPTMRRVWLDLGEAHQA
ncbi:GNAT family N-acetyltransferase [Candidimonas sp. SYP-B2681]|uniref:bifunctional acetate--CoA ligase family protein/GNAT family N-acetyltransferase n=1 Tax=Candidimonas sp. SYP-B2681 TaxID=2497686 RepID=UPI000F88016B|nr:GNAT family N-acetyltransferase [Candidimonas sp. SYP-B2681]RTZ39931.1 GNAT family N-acetyltransferase [Candidimonas sp. SYP-B2681]